MRYLLLILTLSACEQDKVGHFVVGAGAAIVARETGLTTLQTCVATLVLGGLKEIHDSRYGGTVEIADALSTGAGCIISLEF